MTFLRDGDVAKLYREAIFNWSETHFLDLIGKTPHIKSIQMTLVSAEKNICTDPSWAKKPNYRFNVDLGG